MKKIVKSPKSRAQHAQHVTFMKNVSSAVPESMATKYGFAPQWTAFNGALGNEVANYKPDKGFLNTPEVVSIDRKRDEVYLFYSRIVRDYADYCPEEEKKKAATTLAFVFQEAGDVARKELSAETALLNDIIERLQEEPYASALAVIGLEEMPEKLKAANDAFNAIFVERTSAEREAAFATNLKTLRPITDDAYDDMVEAINALYAVNELVAKDEETRTELGEIIDNVNALVVRLKKTVGSSTSSSKNPDDTPEPTPVTPEITAVYQKEGGDPENPHRIERGKQTGVEYQGFTLKGQDGTLEHVIGLVNDQDYIEWIKPETISNVTETGCEFTMVPDLTEGQYKVRIETYDGGSPLVVEYPEPITLW